MGTLGEVQEFENEVFKKILGPKKMNYMSNLDIK
jgi:hypothetical protein